MSVGLGVWAICAGTGGSLMADGKTHAHYAGMAASVLTIGATALAIGTDQPVVIAVAVGGWGAYLAGPDMDHEAHTEDEARIWRINPLLGRLWTLYWRPYEKMIPHRGRSHTLPDGTVDRFFLLFWPFLMFSVTLVSMYGAWLVAWWSLVLMGQILVDCVHLWLDGLLFRKRW